MAFQAGDYETLRDIHRRVTDEYAESGPSESRLNDYWLDDRAVRRYSDSHLDYGSRSLQTALAFTFLAKGSGFYARILLCWTETSVKHAVCEVADADISQAYYLDCRCNRIVTLDAVRQYGFFAASPWNPIPNDTRTWEEL